MSTYPKGSTGYLGNRRMRLPKTPEELASLIPIKDYALKYNYTKGHCVKMQQNGRCDWYKFGHRVYFYDKPPREAY